ncbi:MAG: hypothetical protein LBQ40_05505 [Clostridiales bacterium]|jgi:hypothetical protein|nr:hypothetical protein [Clostridiales bacterium]
MKSLSRVWKEKTGKFVLIAFATLFIVLFFSMLLNYLDANFGGFGGVTVAFKAFFAAVVLITVVFYQYSRLTKYLHDRLFVVLLDLFAAVDFLIIFYDNNVNVFNVVTTLYLVVSISAIVWISVGLVKKRKDKNDLQDFMAEFYTFMNEIKIALIVMASILFTQCVIFIAVGQSDGVKLMSGGASVNAELNPAYMFFATAALIVQLTQILLLQKNFAAKIASALMFFSGLAYGISLIPFFRFTFTSTAAVVIAIMFIASVVFLIGGNIFKSGKESQSYMSKIYVKNAVVSVFALDMALLFVNGIKTLPQETVDVFYFISAALSVALLIYVVKTYNREKLIADPSYLEKFQEKQAKKLQKAKKNGGAQASVTDGGDVAKAAEALPTETADTAKEGELQETPPVETGEVQESAASGIEPPEEAAAAETVSDGEPAHDGLLDGSKAGE